MSYHRHRTQSSIISHRTPVFYQGRSRAKKIVLVDGHDIRYSPGESLQNRQIWLVLQVITCFSGTVMRNIRYSRTPPRARRIEDVITRDHKGDRSHM